MATDTQHRVLAFSFLFLLTLASTVFMLYNNDEGFFSNAQEKAKILLSTTYTRTAVDAIYITGNSDLQGKAYVNGWPGTGNPSDPIIIENYIFINELHMFIISETTLYFEFRNNLLVGIGQSWCALVASDLKNGRFINNTIHSAAAGMHMIRVNDTLIANNTIYNNLWDGVFLDQGCNRNTITKNELCDHREAGIFGWKGCRDNKIMDNNIYDSWHGVAFISDSGGNSILQNEVYDTTISGIHCETKDNHISGNELHDIHGDGICVNASGCTIEGNLVYNNTGIGINVLSAANSTTSYNNVLIKNHECGVTVTSSNCEFMFNDFLENGDLQATDSGIGNSFSSNYWLDWEVDDQNLDGYLDTPKPLGGSAENTDSQPSTNPNNEWPDWYELPTPTSSTTSTTSTTTSTMTNTTTNSSIPERLNEETTWIILSSVSIAIFVVALSAGIRVLSRRRN